MPFGRSQTSRSLPHDAISRPMAPPAIASMALSVSSCRMRRRRPAPSAARIAISDCRDAARASIRFATLAQAISSTRPTAPSSTSSAVRVSPMMCSRERRDREADVGIALGELRLQPSRDGRDVGRRAIRRYARLQPPDDLDVPGTAVLHAEHLVVLDRRPQLHARRVREAGGQNADDHVRLAVEREHAPDRRGAGAEPLLPELMTEQHDAGAARFVLLWAKRAPEDWLHAQHAEQARAHLSAVQPHRFTDARQRHPERVARGNIGQRVVLRADVEKVRRGHHGLVTVPRQMEYADELVRPVIRQRFEQDAVHDREDGAVGPDAERQRDERHDREGRRLPEATERVDDVLAHGVHDVPAAAARSVPAPLRDGWCGVPVFGPGWQEVAGAARARSTRLFAAGTMQSRKRTGAVTWEEAGGQSEGRA